MGSTRQREMLRGETYGAAHMLIRVGYDMAFHCLEPTAMVLMLSLHPSRASTIRQPERLEVQPDVAVSEFLDTFGNRCSRVFVPAGRVMLHNEAIVEDTGQPDPQVWEAPQHNVQDVADDVLQFLLASRYCEVDSALKDLAWTLSGHMLSGWLRVQAICAFVHQHIRFDYMAARANPCGLRRTEGNQSETPARPPRRDTLAYSRIRRLPCNPLYSPKPCPPARV